MSLAVPHEERAVPKISNEPSLMSPKKPKKKKKKISSKSQRILAQFFLRILKIGF